MIGDGGNAERIEDIAVFGDEIIPEDIGRGLGSRGSQRLRSRSFLHNGERSGRGHGGSLLRDEIIRLLILSAADMIHELLKAIVIIVDSLIARRAAARHNAQYRGGREQHGKYSM